MTVNSSSQPISAELLEILVCPIDKQPVRVEGDHLVCSQCGRVFTIVDGIPNMLVEDGQ
ncbi:MAG: Trm112 family protein [Thermomicrobiales bacterium]